MTKEKTNCYTCGCKCDINDSDTGHDGTRYYIPKQKFTEMDMKAFAIACSFLRMFSSRNVSIKNIVDKAFEKNYKKNIKP